MTTTVDGIIGIVTTGNVTANNFFGNIDGNSITGNLNITGNITATANISGFNVSAANQVYVGPLQLRAINPTTFGVFQADGVTQANIDVGNVDASQITQGNSVIAFTGVDGNAFAQIDGNVILEITPDGTITDGTITINAEGATPAIFINTADNNPLQASITTQAARGTFAAPLPSQPGDQILALQSSSYTNFGVYQPGGKIQIFANGPATTSSTNVPSIVQLLSTDNSGVSWRMQLDDNGNLILPGRIDQRLYSNIVDPSISVTSRARGNDVGNIAPIQVGDTLNREGTVGYTGNGTITRDGIPGWSFAAASRVTAVALPSSAGAYIPTDYTIESVSTANTINVFKMDNQGNLTVPGTTIYLDNPGFSLQIKAIDANTLGVFKADGVTQANIDIGNVDASQITQGNSLIAFDGVDGNAFVTIDGSNVMYVDAAGLEVTGNVNPTGNQIYSLGNSTNQWKDLWVAGNTIYVQNIPLTMVGIGLGSNLQVNGANVLVEAANGNTTLANAIISGNATIGGTLVTTGNITGGNINTAGDISGDNFSASGNVAVTGNVSAYNVSAANQVYIGPLQLRAINPTTFGVFQADGVTQANIDVGNIDAAQITQGNSVISFTGVDGNAYVQIDGANVAEITTDGLDVTGNVTVTGTITAPGTSTDVLFNEAGVISASPGLQFNYASNALSIAGNITVAGDATFLGNAVVSGNIQQISGNAGQFFGNLITGTEALYAGIPLGYTVDPASVLQLAGNLDGYVQLESQNINPGPQASFDYVITADDGDNSNRYITMGMTSSTWDGTAPDSITDAVGPRDGYMYVDSGNLVLGTKSSGKTVKILSGGDSATSIVANFTASGMVVTGGIIASSNIRGANFNTVGTVIATSNVTGGNITTAGQVVATGNVVSSANVDAVNLNIIGLANVVGNITGGNINTANLVAASVLQSNVATGTAPLIVASTTKVNNLNADLLDGYDTSITAVADTVVVRDANANVYANNFVGNAIQVLGDIIAGGNLNISGNINSTDVTNITVTDPIISLGRGANNTPLIINDGLDRGTQMWYFTTVEKQAFIGYENVSGKMISAVDVDIVNEIVTVNSYGNFVTGGIEAATALLSGNLTAANLITGGIIDATGNISGGNINTVGQVVATGDITTTTQVIATGNITGGNLITLGNAEVGGILTDNYYYANGAPVDFEQPAGGNRMVQYNNDGNFGASANFAFNSATNSLFSERIFANFLQSNSSVIVLDSSIGGNLAVSGVVTVVTDVSVGGNIAASGFINGSNISASGEIIAIGNVSGDNFTAAGNATVTGNVTGGNLNTAGEVAATGNISGGNLITAGELSAIGNISGGNILTAGEVFASSDVTGSNLNTGGEVFAIGNVTGGNVITSGRVIATGNVSGDSFIASGNVNATGNITGGNLITAGEVFATGDVTGGNLNTSGEVFAAGNLQAGNITTAGEAFATGNITGGNLITAGNAAVGGILTDNYYYANGTPVDFEQPAGSNTQVQYNNDGNFGASAAFSFDEVANVLTVGGDIGANNAQITNDLSSNTLIVTANATIGNISTVAFTASGEANVDSLVVVVDANIGGIANIAGDIEAGSDIVLVGNLDITGNISQVTAQTARIFGDDITGIQALRAGVVTGFANLATSVIQASTNNNDYSQVNQQNVNNGNVASADYVITANDGDDTNYFLDLGLTSSGWDGTQLNSLGNALFPRDGYLYVNQGNLVIGTDSAAKTVKIISGAPDSTGIVATFNAPGTDSTGTGSGALVLTGGLGVSETINSAALNTGDITAANVTMSGDINAANLTLTGTAAVTGNITGGNLITGGQVVATGNIVTSANISGGNLAISGTATVVGNIDGGNLNTAGQVVAIGNVSGGNITTAGQVVATGNVVSSANINGVNFNASGNVVAAGNIDATTFNGNLVGNVTATTITATGNITGGNLNTAGQVVATGNIVTSANIDGVNFNASGNVAAGNISATTFTGNVVGNITLPAGGNIQAPGANTQVLFNDAGNINATSGITFNKTNDALAVVGNITAANIYANSGTIGATLLTGTLTTVAQPNVTSLGTLNQLTVSNTTANIISLGPLKLQAINTTTFGVFQADGVTQANIDVGALEVTSIVQGTSVIGIDALNGNSYITVAGSNVFLANASGTYTTGIANATGNVNGANITTPGVVAATGNVIGGNITTAGQVVATANVVGGNITTAGQVVATGNISGANAVIAANVVAGNLNSDVLTSRGLDLTLETTGTDKSILLIPTGLGTVDVSSVRITSLADPTNDTDAATKAYVDQFVQGILVKASVRVATTTGLPAFSYNNGTAGVGATITALAVGVLVVDGVNTVLGDRILVKNETAGLVITNGIYVVTTEGTAGAAFVLTRSLDMDTPGEVAGAFTFVQVGSTNADSGWVCTANQPVTIGTTAITWSQFSGAGSYTAGSGIALTGTTFSANVDGTTTAIIAGNIAVKNSAVLTTPNVTDATGNSITLTGGNGAFTGTSMTVTGTVLAGNIYANSGTIGASLLTGTITTAAQPNITTLGSLTLLNVTGNLAAGNISSPGQAVIVGNITGGNIATVGVINATANITGGNLVTGGILNAAGNVVSSANVNAVNVNPSGNIVVGINASVGGNATVTGNITAGNLVTPNKVEAAGNIVTSGGFFVGDGGFLSNVSVTAVVGIQNGTSNVSIPTLNGNIRFNVAGLAAGNLTPTTSAYGVGAGAAGLFSTAIGAGAGGSSQGAQATALGYNAGGTGQGASAVAIGAYAGQTNQIASSIAINGTGAALNPTGPGLFIAPVRGDNANTTQVTFYNTATNEFTYSSRMTLTGDITAGNVYANLGTIGASSLTGTLTTAAQPSITSVGTLSALAVTANILAGNVYANAGTIGASSLLGTLGTAAQPTITSVGTLSSLTVSGALNGTLSTAAQPSITSVGTLSSLTVSGALNGTLSTAAQPSITSVGTLTSLAVTNNITAGGTVSAATLTGTLSTAAQPSITSVGTLTSLNVTGTTAVGSLNTTIITAGSAGTVGTITGDWNLSAGSTLQATYSDLGERYSTDVVYAPGTVLMIGGAAETTLATHEGRFALAGIVSTDPAYILNSTLKDSAVIALAGRVPCKVVGKINKGDILTVSHIPGVACATKTPEYGTIIARALESYDSSEVGVIEVKVDRG
jgi:hypothetical protein